MILLNALLLIAASLQAKDLSYLPRNEDVETVSSGQQVVLKELYCNAAQQLIARAQACQECVLLKAQCPDCCLASPVAHPFEALRCTGLGNPWGVDPAIACNPTPKFDGTCTQSAPTHSDTVLLSNCSTTSIPHVEARGCPSVTPKDVTASPVVPDFLGCNNIINSFHGTYFNVTTVGGNTNATPTTEYQDFVDACVADADARETCGKTASCCLPAVCGGGGGYAAHCVDLTCKTRLSTWERANRTVETIDRGTLECYGLTNGDCLALNDQAQSCLNDVAGGTCGGCFRKIYPDDSFVYKFVAKSSEKVVILWRLYTNSTGDVSQSDYFYSKIQVENSRGEVVYSSPVHQKVFQGSFGVFSAIAVTPDMVHTGEEYYARLYYFINQNLSLNLQMNVTGAEIVAIRVRE
ncbi:MAG TPA: hypothetical protein VNI01_00835 [Elusimicrobiota bacterium]|jgi:hypothetical protein|nr:hypothetical protein [Elusimicrobiota bacterium]